MPAHITMEFSVEDGQLIVRDQHADPMMRVNFRGDWTNEEKRAVMRGILAAIDALPCGRPVRSIDLT